jgi:Ser/Thr protein kinase RdoA (MazF antagonist)
VSSSGSAVSLAQLPTDEDWNALGLRIGRSLYGGHQSRVFLAEFGGRQVVVKLTVARLMDTAHERRVELADQLARHNRHAVGPLRIGSSLVQRAGDWQLVVLPFVTGRHPDIGRRGDVAAMATALASLHRTLASLTADLPRVAALRAGDGQDDGHLGAEQLLHGDFSANNVFLGDDGPKVFDYDDCGYGPVEFELGNTLYMALFDATIGGDLVRYHRFRQWFVAAYERAAERRVGADGLDVAIALRKKALGRWLDDPELAPVGIRTASPAWRERLRVFVDDAAGPPPP